MAVTGVAGLARRSLVCTLVAWCVGFGITESPSNSRFGAIRRHADRYAESGLCILSECRRCGECWRWRNEPGDTEVPYHSKEGGHQASKAARRKGQEGRPMGSRRQIHQAEVYCAAQELREGPSPNPGGDYSYTGSRTAGFCPTFGVWWTKVYQHAWRLPRRTRHTGLALWPRLQKSLLRRSYRRPCEWPALPGDIPQAWRAHQLQRQRCLHKDWSVPKQRPDSCRLQ